jgi:hypothetical protein
VKNNLDTLLTALYVELDDRVLPALGWSRTNRAGRKPALTDAELLCLAVAQQLLGVDSERRWIRYARTHLAELFPYLPGQSGFGKRLRSGGGLLAAVITELARDTASWSDVLRLVDSTPLPCAASRETVKRSDLAGHAGYGYCASHSRFFWGLRLHLLCTLHGLPVGFALAGAKADERQTLLGIFEADPELPAWRTGQVVITDKNYYGREFEAELAAADLDLLRPARKGEKPRPGTRFFKPLRQVIESVNDTFKGQLDLEQHGGHTPAGVWVRVVQRVLALTAAIWHNDRTGQPIKRSLIAYDH